MRILYFASAGLKMQTSRPGKKATNVTVDADLLREAKALDINLSQVLERGLADVVRQARERRWLAENEAAIEEYNLRIARDGLWSDGFRRF
jgi:antitoxin CcdA